jgi:hypothetical protein
VLGATTAHAQGGTCRAVTVVGGSVTITSAGYVVSGGTKSEEGWTLDQQPIGDPAAFARARSRADLPPPQTTDHDALARFYHRRGLAAGEIGRAGHEIADLRQAAESGARAGRSDQHEILFALAMAEIQAGSFSRGQQWTRAAIGKVPSSLEAWKIGMLAILASLDARAGDLAAASQGLAEATRLHAKWRGSIFMPAIAVASSEASVAEARATVLAVQGDYAQAEPLFRRAVTAVAGIPELARFPWHDYLRGRVAEILVRQGVISRRKSRHARPSSRACARAGGTRRRPPTRSWCSRMPSSSRAGSPRSKPSLAPPSTSTRRREPHRTR